MLDRNRRYRPASRSLLVDEVSAPGCLVDFCRPVSSINSHKHLRSDNRGQLQVPRIRMSTYGSGAFGHAGQSI